jgi:RNA polymerase sigma factor (sigma-70 family)
MDDATHRAIRATWAIEAPRLIGGLARFVRNIDLAEDLAQEALVLALEAWPRSGIPENPGAWLMTAARNRAIDGGRRRAMMDSKQASLEASASAATHLDVEALDQNVGDDVLRLILIACHPVLSIEARVALTLRLLGGLSTEEIARAYLVPETTVSQRIVRAKRTLVEARVPFEVPQGQELVERLPAVLEVIYLIFNEGYAATQGEHWVRPELCDDAIRLGRVLAELVPTHTEVHGLVALMEIQASRLAARVGPDGKPILLLDQDRSRWDRVLIDRGLEALERSAALKTPFGLYALQAAIAACHARARTAGATDWLQIVALYDALAEVSGSPVVELNRAVAISMAFGPAEALVIVDRLAQDSALADYHLLPSVRGDLLMKLGRRAEARVELERAAALATNGPERKLLLARAAASSQ